MLKQHNHVSFTTSAANARAQVAERDVHSRPPTKEWSMKVVPLTVAAALSLGVGLADASENEGGEGIATTPRCIPATADKCNQIAPLLPPMVILEPEPKASPTSAAQAKRFFLLY
jgi:hypothetical protein